MILSFGLLTGTVTLFLSYFPYVCTKTKRHNDCQCSFKPCPHDIQHCCSRVASSLRVALNFCSDVFVNGATLGKWALVLSRINDRKDLIISTFSDLCACSPLPVLCICHNVSTRCFLCVFVSVRLHALDNDIYELCMCCGAFHSISALIPPPNNITEAGLRVFGCK